MKRGSAVALVLLLTATSACAQASRGEAGSQAEALWREGRYTEASDAFAEAVKRNPNDPELRVRWGRLWLERINPTQAPALFQEALKLKPDYPPALLGMALIMADAYDTRAVELAEKALAADPKLIEARELLARLALEDGNYEKANAEAAKAGNVAVPAIIEWLQDREPKQVPTKAADYALAGRIFVLNRRYEEGIAHYRKALEKDPKLASARSELGVQLMRLGRDDEARRQLEKSYADGYRNPATVNSLRLMDSYKNFEVRRTPTTVVKLHKKESELLGPYVESELLRAMATFEKKYKLKLSEPVQVEVYPDHEDFAVRTLGMPGLGALGVTFGSVVAMDSPSGRKPGSFHWASTLWHELSHVYVLTATHHRVPRWFTEGMAVHEETAASPEWGDRVDPAVISAMQKKQLLPIKDLDRGFIRPSYPAQVGVSYFQAGRICDYIMERWGYDKLLAMMHAFGRSKTTPEVVQEELGISPAAFDTQFLAWLDAKLGKVVEANPEWKKRMAALGQAAEGKQYDAVIRDGPAVRELYPEYVEEHSAYELIADAYLAKGDKANAAAELERYARAGGRDPGVLKKLAGLHEEAGRRKQAVAALDRILYVYPMDEEVHRKLGELLLLENNPARAAREFEAVIHARPMDQASSRFNLARALRAQNKLDDAREQLLLALEAAPGYKPAQKMLLEITQ